MFAPILSEQISQFNAAHESRLNVLAVPNTYFGGTVINSGTLKLGASNSLPDVGGVTVATGATLDLAGLSDTIGDLHVNGTVTAGTLTTPTVDLGAGALIAANLKTC